MMQMPVRLTEIYARSFDNFSSTQKEQLPIIKQDLARVMPSGELLDFKTHIPHPQLSM
jgi:hypothetical protein